MTYSRNISRLKERTRSNLSQEVANRTNAAVARGNQQIREANDVATKLSGFSDTLYKWKLADIKKQEVEGRQKYEEVRSERAEHAILKEEYIQAKETKEFYDLAGMVEEAKRHDVEYQRIKAATIEAGGIDAYPEADRIAKLSEHQQVGYLKAKLGAFADTYGDKLNHTMLNSNQPIKIGNLTFTSAELREHHISSLPLKEAAMRVHSKSIMKAAGLDKFSPEMLALAGVTDTMEKVHKSQLAKHRARYNIDSSHNERTKATNNWKSIPANERSGFDLYQLFLTHSNTVDEKNELLGSKGGWDSVFSILTQEAIRDNSPAKLEYYAGLEIPQQLRKQLGLKPGTTYGDHWGSRFDKARADYSSGVYKAAETKRKELKAATITLGNQFQEESRKGPINEERLAWWEEQSWNLSGALDERIKNYKTISARNIEQDKKKIKGIMATQNGYINHTTLDQFHPEAALDFRDDADKHAAALNKKYNVDNDLKAALNESWTGAGMKQKEKSVVWEFAFANAKRDYERQFNNYIANGYKAPEAHRLAMRGGMGEAVNKEDGESFGNEGVLTEIQRMGAGSKYTRYGEDQQKLMKDAHLRVQAVDEAKKELQADPYAEQTKVIGGKYGRDRLNEIKESIEKHGTWEGIRRAEKALDYYEGVSLGKRGLFAYGLIDAQLKADGHPGLFPNRTLVMDSSGAVKAGTTALQPTKYRGSVTSYNTVVDNTMDLVNYYSGAGSIFNQPENLAGWLQ